MKAGIGKSVRSVCEEVKPFFSRSVSQLQIKANIHNGLLAVVFYLHLSVL